MLKYTPFTWKNIGQNIHKKMKQESGKPLCPRKERGGVFVSLQKATRAPSRHLISDLTKLRLSVRREHENKIHEKRRTRLLVSTKYYEYSQHNKYSNTIKLETIKLNALGHT